jgi:hypothetical protein
MNLICTIFGHRIVAVGGSIPKNYKIKDFEYCDRCGKDKEKFEKAKKQLRMKL